MPWIAQNNPSNQNVLTQNICELTVAQIGSTVAYSGLQATPLNTTQQLTTGGGGPSGGVAVGNVSTINPGARTPSPMLNIQAAVLINQVANQLTRFPSA